MSLGAADHILATRYLSRFIDDTPWLLWICPPAPARGGLGAVMTDLTGFGVGWGLAWMEALDK